MTLSYPDYATNGADTDCIEVCAIIGFGLSRHFPTTLQNGRKTAVIILTPCTCPHVACLASRIMCGCKRKDVVKAIFQFLQRYIKN